MTTQQEYPDDFAEVIETIRQHELAEQQAAESASNPPSEQPKPTTTETEGKTEAKTEGEGSTAVEAPAVADKQGDPRAALRHARRSERQARDEASRLKAELEEARKQIPAPKDDGVTDAELAELEADAPLYAKALKEIRALKAQLPKAAAPAAAKDDEPDFIPPVQQPHIQDAIDDIPDLLAMQNDPDQSAFDLAVQTDALLKKHPKWTDKPLAERLAECARRVKAELGEPAAAAPTPPQKPAAAPAPATPRRDPAAAAAKAEKVPPSTLSDIAGGAAPTTESAPSVEQIMKMSDEDMLLALERFG